MGTIAGTPLPTLGGVGAEHNCVLCDTAMMCACDLVCVRYNLFGVWIYHSSLLVNQMEKHSMGNRKKSNTKAKQKSVVTDLVPDAFKSTIKISEDNSTVFLTHSVPRYFECVVRETIDRKPYRVACEIDSARIFGSTRLRAIFERGLKKQLIDGAKGSEQVKQAGETVTRTFSFEEKCADAVSTMESNLDWLYGIREKSEYNSNRDPVLCSAIDALSVWLVKNCTTDTGGRYTRNKLPKVLKNANTLEDFRAVAEQFGCTEKRTERIIANAQAIHSDDEEEIDVAE